MFKHTKRKEWVTRGSDPTVVVQWRIYGTCTNGECDPQSYVELEEFQGLYHGTVFTPMMGLTVLPDSIAKQLHVKLEDEFQEAEHQRDVEDAEGYGSLKDYE